MTKTLKFKCTLLSDVVLSQTSSSEGNQKTLDFIPGNNFLGIVASKMYKDRSKESLEIFHSGKVRFGDAHPSTGGVRGLKVPASMYYPKFGSASEECYIHHLTDLGKQEIKDKQLKQCREGFYSFIDKTGKPVEIDKNYTIKSAYDSEKRRSKDGKMFGYESLPKDLVLYFEVESDLSDQLTEAIAKVLCGKKQIGHSRSAEFGLVNIESEDFKEIESSKVEPNTNYITVYADGRLVFFDKNFEPTLQPEADDLGVKGGEIDWSKSQIRTFQYAPWNGWRHTYDADRCGIEKGSVFVVKLNDRSCPEKSNYVGAYNNEGFGKVIYNPTFLAGNQQELGKALFTLEAKENKKAKKMTQEQKESKASSLPKPDSSLIDLLIRRQRDVKNDKSVFEIVQAEVKDLEPIFQGEQFASQWGFIRSLAMSIEDNEKLYSAVETFLSHGVAELKWSEQSRKARLMAIMAKYKNKDLQSIMINLASEMAKKCKSKEDN